MANTVVTSAAKYVKAVFNLDSAITGTDQGYFSKDHIAEIRAVSSGFVVVRLDYGATFAISIDGSKNTLKVDSIDGIAPVSNNDLCDKIAALMDY